MKEKVTQGEVKDSSYCKTEGRKFDTWYIYVHLCIPYQYFKCMYL